ncbi:MAG TPA: phosphoglucosamine mutase [Longimicrobium sp.]|jgi:phosphomannomutase
MADDGQIRLDLANLMVSVSGMRGRVGEGLTPEVVAAFAAAFGAYARRRGPGKTVVLGRDSRVSGPMFARAATAALQSAGCDVVDVGLAPTPSVQLAVEDLGAAGGLAVTASHNPIEWNALKFIGPSGMFLDGDEAVEMRGFLHDAPRAGWKDLGQWREDAGAVERHLERIFRIPFLDVELIRSKRFPVALDCVRGAGGTIFPRLLEALGCRVEAINLETDGLFPRKPEPVAENLGELEELVRRTGAVVGLATDPDVDRLSLVSDEGRAIGEDYTLALAATLVLRHRPGALVTNLSTSRLLDDVAERAGVPLFRAPVGEINVARRMQKEGATVGGEGNGGVILPDVHLTRDAPVAAALVLQLLAETGRPLSRLAAEIGRYEIVKEALPRPGQPLDAVYDALAARFPEAEADRQDGLRLSWPARRAWAHLRPSGTEPIVRIICEAPSREEAVGLVETLRAALPG